MLKSNLGIMKRIAVLLVMVVGLFYVASINPNPTMASTQICCTSCDALAASCEQLCNDLPPGSQVCRKCQQRAATCYYTCDPNC